MAWTSAEIRNKFLNYFAEHGHKIMPSSSLVPGNDPTLLFTNAGMVQFKDVFLGREKLDCTRATTSQRCVRAGGKHNDLEQVGYTVRHHTFFEMLGNFSFGDYFKRDAIELCWTFLTEILKMPKEKLWVTVYKDDQEAEDIWLKEIGVDPKRFSRCGEADNFWSMGDTGPCGPCSEVFYDHGPDVPGGPPGTPEQDGDRYIEIWNLVFMQYDRQPSGELKALPNPSVDTGMGLERLAAVLQGVHSNYQTDLFTSIIDHIKQMADDKKLVHTSVCAIADHIRSCSFLVLDGVIPSNEGRGYVLRRIIRRAIRHGHQIGIEEVFFYKLLSPLIEVMGQAYPELVTSKDYIEQVLLQEEQQFSRTLDQGLRLLEAAIAELQGDIIPGETLFRLYDTYGFPPDLTADIARERHLQIDLAGFEVEMAKQREKSQAASQFSSVDEYALNVDVDTLFSGYGQVASKATIVALFTDGKGVETLTQGQEGMVVLEQTPFYAESGGQVGDSGSLIAGDNEFTVTDTQKHGSAFYHYGRMAKGQFSAGDCLQAQVDNKRRQAIMYNHSATHLLHAALRELLGSHVTQKGSLVAADKLRFDFSHFAALSEQELEAIEARVNEKIRENLPVTTELMSPEAASAKGAMALFGEKYGHEVRVLQMGDFSLELCGGTHVKATGEIGLFKITSETGIAAGVRRIEAVTGEVALDLMGSYQKQLIDSAALLKAKPLSVVEKLSALIQQQKKQEKEIRQLQAKLASGSGSDLSDSAININGIQLVTAKFEGVDVKTLRNTMDNLKNKLKSSAIVLATVQGDKIQVVAGVTKPCLDRLHAGDIVNHVAQQIGGKGGGRPDMAQAGGNNPQALDSALNSVKTYIEDKLA